MKFKGDIIITDPCYISKDSDWGDSFNFDEYCITNDSIKNYIWEDTGVGDGSFNVYEVSDKKITKEFVLKEYMEDHIVAFNDDIEDEYIEKNKIKQIGEFTADSGCFGVFMLDEVLKYNPEFLDTLPEQCRMIIKDFDGRINVYRDDQDVFHIIGLGNKSFYTI